MKKISKKYRRTRVVVPPEFEDIRSLDYKSIYSTGVFGGLDPNDGRMIFFIDHVLPKTVNEPYPGAQKIEKIVREHLIEVHLTPTQFKSIAMWMSDHVKRYEEHFGAIPMRPKTAKGPPPTMIT